MNNVGMHCSAMLLFNIDKGINMVDANNYHSSFIIHHSSFQEVPHAH